MFSVIIPLYNKEKNVVNTVRSVLNQTFTDFELIVVNDGSTDNSVKQIEENIHDKRVRVISKKNGGVSSARNVGINSAKHDYIAFLDADDIWLPYHLDVLNQMINKYEDSIGGAGYITNYIKSDSITTEIEKEENIQFDVITNYFAEAKNGTVVHTSNIVIAKNILVNTSLFDERLSIGEDTEFWARVFKNNTLVRANIVTSIYFMKAENRCSNNKTDLHKRFHKFNFENLKGDEKEFYQRLASIVVLDYLYKKQFKTVFKLLLLYRKHIGFIFNYLIRKAINKTKK